MRNRIEAAMLKARLNQTSLAELMGVTPQAVQQWIKEGGTNPKGKRLSALASVLNVSVGWLVTGQGEKQPGQERIAVAAAHSLSPRQQAFLDLINALPTLEQDKLMRELEEKDRYFRAVYEDMKRKAG